MGSEEELVELMMLLKGEEIRSMLIFVLNGAAVDHFRREFLPWKAAVLRLECR